MSSLGITAIVFVCVFGGALLGMFVRRLLPDEHLGDESKNAVTLAMGLVATTLALVLGLLVASAKSFYDTQSTEVTQLAANVVLLDRILAHYGPETAELRSMLRDSVSREMALMWPSSVSADPYNQPAPQKGEALVDRIQELSPHGDHQQILKAQALNLAVQVGQTRWLIFEQRTVPIPTLLLVTLLVWLSTLFISFGLFSPVNLTVLTSLVVAAGAASGAILLILEMYHPYTGLIKVSDAPLRAALAQLGQ